MLILKHEYYFGSSLVRNSSNGSFVLILISISVMLFFNFSLSFSYHIIFPGDDTGLELMFI